MSGVPDYTLEDTIDFKFSTRQFSTGAPFAFASGAVEIYEDNSVTQITGGETLTLEFDGVTGLHNLRVVATAANGFEDGKSYQCVVSAGTVDSVSVIGEVVQQFSIGRSTINAASIDLIWDEVLTGGTHNVTNSAGRRIRQLQEAGGYGGFVWIDTADGTAGTTSFENGTDTLPVLTLADALTIAGNVNIKNFMATRDTVLAPAADFNNFTVYGTGYTLTLGGHDYAGTHIFHASPLTGIATSTGNSDHFDVLDSIVGAVTVDDAHFTNCAHVGDITLSGVGTATPGQLRLVNCFSLVANDGDVAIDFGTGSENHDVNVIDWQGNLQLTNFNVVTTGGTDTINITGKGKLLIDASCDSGTIYLRGHWDVQDNSSGAVTITRDDPAASIIAIEVDTADMQPKLGTPATDVSADIAAIKAETALIVADTNELLTDDIPGLIAALNDPSVADILTTQMTESYAADGAAPTLAQALMMIQQHLTEFAISGTTWTTKKVDGSTTAGTFTLDDDTNPTSITRAT